MEMADLESVKKSALWAAYGDALGFISELADESRLKWRTGSSTSRIVTTIPWKRKIGGKFGVVVELPAGCYSDDTQLRLATCRAIRGDGKFDVEAFSKVEIPVWLSYALGAGNGSKAAAASLSRRDITWTTNFFEEEKSRYVNNGGNGAAMRIQPHVWASVSLCDIKTFLPDVIKNSICTHGHSRGVLGAVFHALCLAHALHKKDSPEPSEWNNFVEQFHLVSELIQSDNEINDVWLPTWEKSTGQNLVDSFKKVAEECFQDIKLAQQLTNGDSVNNYARLVNEAGGMTQYRGSGTKTAIFAAFLAWTYRDNPRGAMEVAANLLGSDTDTIATMAGTILGAITKENPPGKICDKIYIEEEASRLCDISHRHQTKSFTYPDLLKWNAPSVQADFVGTVNDQLAISGFGYVKMLGNSYVQRSKNAAVWQWLQLSFGQQILAKRRLKPFKIPITNLPLQIEEVSTERKLTKGIQKDLFDNSGKKKTQHDTSKKRILTINEATKQAINSGFDPTLIGQMLLEFSERKDGIEQAVSFSAIIAKARKARTERGK